MNIGLVIYGNLSTVSGGYLYDRKLVEHLRACGDDVQIFEQKPRSYALNLLDNANSGLARDIRDAELDVLLEDELNHPSLLRLNRKLRDASIPIVSIVHHLRSSEDFPAWQQAIYRWLERAYLRSVDGFVFNGETTRQVVHSVAGYSEPSVIATPAGDRFNTEIDELEITGRSLQEGPLDIVFLGSVIPRKGMHTVVEAISGLSDRNWNLSVIGRLDVDERYTSDIRRRVQAAGIVENVTLYGPLPDREIARLLRRGHIMVIPSSYEGYGIAYLEGMAFGLPAIGTTSGAAWEVIRHQENGWLVEPGDAGAITEILTEIQQDRSKLNQMSQAARLRFMMQPGWSTSMNRVRSFLKSVVSAVKP